MREISRAPRYIAVASPSQDSNREWNHAWPPVSEDYALLKVLFMLRQQRNRSPARVHAFRYDKTSLTPLDFSGLSDAHVIFIVGHGDSNGLYAMGPDKTKGMERLIQSLTGDGNLKKRRQGKSVTVVLLSCRAGLGLHAALAHELADAIGIKVTVVGAIGFTFGSENTDDTGFNSVLIKGIPWWMEYEKSIQPDDAEEETSRREGKTITIAGKKNEIKRFKDGKTKLENELKKVVDKLKEAEVNAALDEIEAKHRNRFVELVLMQSAYYLSARARGGLGFDMWYETIADAYSWVNSSQVSDDTVSILLSADWPPPGPGQSVTR
jgi:hypothetical protein